MGKKKKDGKRNLGEWKWEMVNGKKIWVKGERGTTTRERGKGIRQKRKEIAVKGKGQR